MRYTASINFPDAASLWPSLSDSANPSYPGADSILYSEHPNKLASFITTIEGLLLTATASGNGTVETIPNGIEFRCSVQMLVWAFLKGAFDGSSSGGQQYLVPGSVLPFEFVLTNNTGNVYRNWHARNPYAANQRVLVQIDSETLEDDIGYDVFSNPQNLMVGISLLPGTDGFSKLPSTASYTGLGDLVVFHHIVVNSDEILIRGVIVDNSLPTYSQSETVFSLLNNRWLSATMQHTYVTVTVRGIS